MKFVRFHDVINIYEQQMKINRILIILTFALSINHTIGQNNCMREINAVLYDCIHSESYRRCTHEEMMEKGNELLVNSPYLNCMDYVPYLLKVSDFYYYASRLKTADKKEASKENLSALNKSIELVEKAGEIDSSILKSRAEGAERLAERYKVLSLIYFDLKEQKPYDAAMEKAEYWSDISSGKKERDELLKRIAEEEEERIKEKEKEAIKRREAAMSDTSNTPKRTYVRPYSHRYITKPIGVFAMVQDTLRNLTDDKLEIVAEPKAELVHSENPEPYRYSLSFNERTDYKITVSYPGFEDQYFYFEKPSLLSDTISIFMFPSGTPYFRTAFTKIPFELDTSSILIMRSPNYFPKEEFDCLIKSLGLKKDENNRNKYRKISGEPFDVKSDSVLSILRQKPYHIIPVAGHSLGTPNRTIILTNQLQVIWKKKPEERSPEEHLKVKEILHKYQLTYIGKGGYQDVYEAPPGTGFYLNTIVEELNKLPSVRLAFPESYRTISYH